MLNTSARCSDRLLVGFLVELLLIAGMCSALNWPRSVEAADEGRAAARQRLLHKLRTNRALQPSTPPAKDSPQAKDSLTLTHAGQTRTYRLHLPTTTSQKRLPLVIVLHGFGADAQMTEAMSGFNAVADQHSFAVAYPNGVGRMWRFWENLDGKIAVGSTDDVGFIATLIDQLVRDQGIDRSRVYATGISNGGYMSNRLGYGLSDKIAAIAPVAGSLPKFMSETAKPPRVMPVMTFHGTDDRIVRADGSDAFTKLGLSLSATELAAWWAKADGCHSLPKSAKVADLEADGTTVLRHAYVNQRGEELVVHFEIQGGGHTWPGGSFMPEFLLGKTTRDINASELMWEFFRQHSLPER